MTGSTEVPISAKFDNGTDVAPTYSKINNGSPERPHRSSISTEQGRFNEVPMCTNLTGECARRVRSQARRDGYHEFEIPDELIAEYFDDAMLFRKKHPEYFLENNRQEPKRQDLEIFSIFDPQYLAD